LLKLHRDIWIHIFSFLTNKQILRCRLICKSFWMIVKCYPFRLSLEFQFNDEAFYYICHQWKQLNINYLYIPHPNRIYQNFGMITNLLSLKSVNLHEIMPQYLNHLSLLTRLESIQLYYWPSNSKNTQVEVEFCSHLTNLTSLSFSKCIIMEWKYLTSLPKLSHLNLTDVRNTPFDIDVMLDSFPPHIKICHRDKFSNIKKNVG